MNRPRLPPARIGAALLAALTLGACTPLSMTLLAVGASAGWSHQTGGLAARTFTAPLPRVRLATRHALRRMAIRVAAVDRHENGETIHALAAGRQIEVEIESLSPATTRVRAVARMDVVLVDGATANEIIDQTRKALGS